MSIAIGITPSELKKIKKQLLSQKEVVCLDELSHVKTLLVGKALLTTTMKPVAHVKKGY